MIPAHPATTARKFARLLVAGGLALCALATFSRAQAPPAAPQTPKTDAQGGGAPAPSSGKVTCPVNATTVPPLSAPLAAARDLFRGGKFDEAIAAYNAIVPAGGDEAAAAYAGLARVYLRQKRVADADAAAQKAVALTPDRAPAIVALGEVYFREGKLSQSEKLFITPLMHCNLDARAYLGLERLYIANLNFKTADKYIRQAYLIDPSDPDIRRQYISTLRGQERIDFLKQYLDTTGNDDAETHKNLQEWLDLLVGETKEQQHGCHLVSNVTATETKFAPLLMDPKHMRGLGLHIRINDAANATLMLDTGASGILIDRKVAEKAGVKKVQDRHIGGIGDAGAAEGYLGFADKLQIGELEFHDCLVDVTNSNRVLDDDGLIGADVFRSYLVEVNMPDKKFKLTQLPPFPDEPNAEASLQTTNTPTHHLHDRYMPAEMKDYSPIVLFGHDMLIPTIANKQAPALFLIDTGSWDSTVNDAFARQITKVFKDTDTTVKGLSGKVANVYRADEVNLQFSHFTQRRTDLIAFDLSHISNNVGTEVSGILGFSLLNMLDIKIDYRDGLVSFTYDPNRFH
jgi:tetratricopeptide (TPR) repeat protein